MSLYYKKDHLYFGDKKIHTLCAKNKTPFYVYDLKGIKERFLDYSEAFGGQAEIHYATKANNHPKILRLIRSLGGGVDVVSSGEAKEAIEAGFSPKDIIFSGVAKTESEIAFAVSKGIKQINVESPQELERIGKVAKASGKLARVAFRMNPDVSPNTHPYITTGFRENKFGMDSSFLPELERILEKYKKSLSLVGLTIHIGSQMIETEVVGEAIDKTISLYNHFVNAGHKMETFDIGGGIGIQYKENQNPVDLGSFGLMVLEKLEPLGCRVLCEPGRYIVGPCGILVTEVQYIKKSPYKSFAIVDTGMHHLLRPALYQAYHKILNVRVRENSKQLPYDVVGPICESSDSLGKSRLLNELKQGDHLVIADAGAYGMVMASNYNSHPLPKEIFV